MDPLDALNPYYRPDYAKTNSPLDAATTLASATNPYLGAAQLGLGLLGTTAQVVGGEHQSSQAQKQYELAVQAWQAEKDRQQREDEIGHQQQYFQNSIAGGNYATQQQKDLASPYAAYAKGIGA